MAADELDARAAQRVGQVLNEKWTLERLLGVGGMAAVYAARHRNGAKAAVKMLHPELARHDEVRERFLREGYAANRVEHRGAVQVLDDDVVKEGPDEGVAYLVMELLDGEALVDRAARPPPIDERELLAIMDGVLDVLCAAHARGVVHRDLKPDNLFLAKDPDGGPARVKVLDFGLARIAEGERVTRSGLALGTPSFMSPEQAAGRMDEVDGRTDIFALGATAFRLLTNKRIHDAPNAVLLVSKMANEPAPRIRTVAPAISELMARIIDRALEFRREDRYPTADEMQADVQAALVAMQRAHAKTELALPPASTSSEARNAPVQLAGAPDASGGAPIAATVPGEPTMNLSSGDLEPCKSAAKTAPSPPPSTEPAEPPRAPRDSAREPSVSSAPPPPRRRRSMIPLATVLLYAIIIFVELRGALRAVRENAAGDATADAGSTLTAASPAPASTTARVGAEDASAAAGDPSPPPDPADASPATADTTSQDDAAADAESDEDDEDDAATDGAADDLADADTASDATAAPARVLPAPAHAAVVAPKPGKRPSAPAPVKKKKKKKKR